MFLWIGWNLLLTKISTEVCLFIFCSCLQNKKRFVLEIIPEFQFIEQFSKKEIGQSKKFSGLHYHANLIFSPYPLNHRVNNITASLQSVKSRLTLSFDSTQSAWNSSVRVIVSELHPALEKGHLVSYLVSWCPI